MGLAYHAPRSTRRVWYNRPAPHPRNDPHVWRRCPSIDSDVQSSSTGTPEGPSHVSRLKSLRRLMGRTCNGQRS